DVCSSDLSRRSSRYSNDDCLYCWGKVGLFFIFFFYWFVWYCIFNYICPLPVEKNYIFFKSVGRSIRRRLSNYSIIICNWTRTVIRCRFWTKYAKVLLFTRTTNRFYLFNICRRVWLDWCGLFVVCFFPLV